MEQFLDRTYRVIRFVLDDIIGNVAAFALFAATVLALVEIVRRYILGLVYEWGQDAVTFTIVGGVFLYFAVTQARRGHLVMSAAVDAFRAKGYRQLTLWFRAIVSASSLALFVSFAWWGIPTVERMMMMGRTTQSMVLLLWPFQLCLVVSFGLMALTTLFHLYQDVQALRGKTVLPWAPAEETTDI